MSRPATLLPDDGRLEAGVHRRNDGRLTELALVDGAGGGKRGRVEVRAPAVVVVLDLELAPASRATASSAAITSGSAESFDERERLCKVSWSPSVMASPSESTSRRGRRSQGSSRAAPWAPLRSSSSRRAVASSVHGCSLDSQARPRTATPASVFEKHHESSCSQLRAPPEGPPRSRVRPRPGGASRGMASRLFLRSNERGGREVSRVRFAQRAARILIAFEWP